MSVALAVGGPFDRLDKLAPVIRSKNSGPFEITFDVIFDDPAVYQRVKDSGVLTLSLVCQLYGVNPDDVVAMLFFDPALAFKFTLRRGWAQGSINERDTFGAQQHAPLLDIQIPATIQRTMTPPSRPRPLAIETESRRIARFALGLQLDDVPLDVLHKARTHFLDVLGVALASSSFDFGTATLNGVRTLGEGHQATAIGSGQRLPAASAALLNGVLAHGLDFDDTHIGAIYHASAPAFAATLAAGQANGSNGREALLAFTAALEIGCRLGSVAAGDFHRRGFHPTGLCGTFAASAAAGRLGAVDEDTLVSALGLCGSQAAGLLEIGTSWLKRLHPGWAAHSAVSSLALARAGFVGPDTVFEGSKGFYATHVQTIPQGRDLPSTNLGMAWQTLGIALKPYPCCHFIHAFVDAALALRGQFELADVERIECPLTPMLHPMVADPRDIRIRPQTVYQALFSVPYVVALAITQGRVDLASFHDQPLDSPDVLETAAKIWCTVDEQSDFPKHFPGEVVVQLKDARVLRERCATSLGTPERPMSRATIEAKFMANATRAITSAAATELVAKVTRLETLSSLDELLELCVS